MAGPGCPKDGFKGVQDGVNVIHAQLLWEIWATPSCYKVLHWPMLHDAKCEWGSGRLYVHKTEALRASGPRFFSKKAKNSKKATTTHQEHQKKNRALSTHKIHNYREGVNACFPSAIAQTTCISAPASPPCSQTDSAACLGEGCNALNHIVQVMCMQVLKKVGTHLQGGSQELEIVRMGSVKLH